MQIRQARSVVFALKSNCLVSTAMVNSALLTVILYPLLFLLPINPVRFRWGLNRGITPMPPDTQERAEGTDRSVHFVLYLILIVSVASMVRDSMISADAVGLTKHGWPAAVAWGALLSSVPVSFAAGLLRVLPDEMPDDPASRGPVSSWCGLAVFGAFSTELWRAFGIATLLRLDFSSSFAILVMAAAFAAPQLTLSGARALGALLYGGIAGFLFIRTGSLAAPLTMDFVVAGAYLYGIRQVLRDRSRFDVNCPLCNTTFSQQQGRRTIRFFNCPNCGEALEYESGRFAYLWLLGSFYSAPVLLYYLGYRDFTLIFLSLGAMAFMFFIGMTLHDFVSPPKAMIYLKPGQTGLHLIDRPKHEENKNSDENSDP